MNKKVKTLARKSALSYKVQNNALIVVEDFVFEAPKTKDFVAMTKNLKVSDKKLLVILPEANKNMVERYPRPAEPRSVVEGVMFQRICPRGVTKNLS